MYSPGTHGEKGRKKKEEKERKKKKTATRNWLFFFPSSMPPPPRIAKPFCCRPTAAQHPVQWRAPNVMRIRRVRASWSLSPSSVFSLSPFRGRARQPDGAADKGQRTEESQIRRREEWMSYVHNPRSAQHSQPSLTPSLASEEKRREGNEDRHPAGWHGGLSTNDACRCPREEVGVVSGPSEL